MRRAFFNVEKEFEVDRTLAVSDDHHIVASLVRRFVAGFGIQKGASRIGRFGSCLGHSQARK